MASVKKMQRFGVFFASMLLVTGCSLFKTQQLEIPANLTAEGRVKFLSQLEYWHLDGRIGIIANGESESANISWTQSGENSKLRIYGALGATYALVHTKPGYAKLELSDDEVYEGTNAQYLLWEKTGWNIPVDALREWLLGLPNNAPSFELNDKGYVKSIEFQNWAINFQLYDSYRGLDMPRKLKAKHPDITLKFAIYDWEFTPDD
ncbi:lipoprotein insertase outer membrane protein LolB [Pleionea sediminis]|uniref:lipoprotein insertase outer membrane protein LolB n=1 Tax=Pleionea sediminis TaxID=2569479 RepID=UPI001186E6C0|nr:lipoprotein insertase outer membrane protein LolB [Pleionea sediminis]